jgi:hypothetical protein
MAQRDEASKGVGKIWRFIMWGTILTLLILPALAMQVTAEVNWTASDFVFAAVLLGSVGLGVEATVRARGDWSYRGAMFIAIALAFVTVWANGAVGIIGSEDNPLNLLYFIPLLIGGLAAVRVWFRPRAMCWIMAAVAVAQFAIAAIAAANGYWVWIAAAVIGGGWSLSSILFDRSQRDAHP